MTESMGLITTASGRTLNEMKAEIRIRMRNMVNSALEIGIDLTEAKDACRHGEWLPFLKEIGLSASTAANYMRIAKEVHADSKMAGLPYTKILALLAAPPEEREELAAAAEDMSAAEIRRLTEERNRAAEAANTETQRADQAEAHAKQFYQENAHLRTEIQNLEARLEGKEDEMQRLLRECDEEAREEEREKIQAEMEDLRGKLIVAENQTKIEVVPEDYAQLKRNQQELLEAAASAEDRASAAEAELERMQTEGGPKPMEKPVGIVLGQAMNAFFRECDMMPFDPAQLQRDSYAVRHCLEAIRDWCRRMDDALEMPVITEASVI